MLLSALLLLALVPHLVTKAILGRGPVARWFIKGAGWIIGIRVRRVGPAPPVRSLLIANHVSWLDILALGGATGCAFVSKAEVKDHWLTGWLADQRDTLYIQRQARRSVDQQIAAIAERFDHHLPLAVFPEGTTNDGVTLKPFRPALLSAVTPPPEGASVIPVAIDYGKDTRFVAWTEGEGGIDNALRIFGRLKPIHVTIRMLEPLDTGQDRKSMATNARSEIEDALKASSRPAPAL